MTGVEKVRRKLSDLHFDGSNARRHDEKNLRAILGSLKRFGQVEPLVVQKSTGRVIGGNGRLKAMQELGWAEADVHEVDLSETEATALAIALNRTGELAGWDFEVLSDLLRSVTSDGVDLGELGWDKDELGPLLAAEWKPPEASPEPGEAFAADRGVPIMVTTAQRSIFELAAAKVKESVGDCSEGRCLELICADYLGGT